ncbi:Ger(x)C family spore germination protein [Limnochorda pilosa]|uniref:Ger(x)C family spore germination protein n=1 Tax=Limnochorda pilosa TaxID=1555112 RepID=UPI001E464814|nr:Ger(x)C family spore germination protein [Limnochorda pilosa]
MIISGDIPSSGRAPKVRALRRLAHVALLSLVALASGGCWDRTEVNDLAIVNGVALDRAGPDSLELTIALAVPARITPPSSPGGGGAQLPPTTTRATQGRTVPDALSYMQEKLSRRLFWAHNAVILIGEDLAREGVSPVIEFFSRQREARLRTVIGVVPGRAKDVLAVVTPLQPITPTAIRDIQSFRTSVMTTVLDFAAALSAEGQEPIAARVQVVHSGAAEPGMLEAPQDGGNAGPMIQKDPPQPAVTGAALFKGDRLVGFLDDVETRGVLWLRNELQRATITVTLGDPRRRVSFYLVRAESTLTPRFHGDRVVMQVKVFTEGDLSENAAGVDASDPAVIRLLQQEVAESVAERIRRASEKVQKGFRTDVFGFGEAVRRADPRRWEELKHRWEQVFPEVELDLDIQAFIRRTGASDKPLGVKERGLLDAGDLREMLEGK